MEHKTEVTLRQAMLATAMSIVQARNVWRRWFQDAVRRRVR